MAHATYCQAQQNLAQLCLSATAARKAGKLSLIRIGGGADACL